MTTVVIDLASSLEQVILKIQEVLDDEGAITAPSLPLRLSDRGELGLLRLVGWLYCFYFESAKDALSLIGPDAGAHSDHGSTVHDLRTYFQHHLTESDRDLAIRQVAEDFLSGSQGDSRGMGMVAEWGQAVEKMEVSAEVELRALLDRLAEYSDPPLRELMAEQWSRSQAREFSPHEVDELVESTAGELGMEYVRVQPFREAHYSSWKAQVRVIDSKIDPRAYLVGLIERELLKLLETKPLPVTGSDVMDAFGIGPGPEVGRILKVIKKLHEEDEGSKEQLLDRASKKLGFRLYFVGSD